MISGISRIILEPSLIPSKINHIPTRLKTKPTTDLDQERNGDENGEDKHSSKTVEQQGPSAHTIH